MRAVYRCSDNPFLTLSLEEIVPLVDTEYRAIVPTLNDRGNLVNMEIPACVAVYRDEPKALQFEGGTLTLTDPTEIKGMREYIKRRSDTFITELSFEGDEAELDGISYIKALEPQGGSEMPQGIPQRRHEVDRSDEWDRIMEKRMRR